MCSFALQPAHWGNPEPEGAVAKDQSPAGQRGSTDTKAGSSMLLSFSHVGCELVKALRSRPCPVATSATGVDTSNRRRTAEDAAQSHGGAALSSRSPDATGAAGLGKATEYTTDKTATIDGETRNSQPPHGNSSASESFTATYTVSDVQAAKAKCVVSCHDKAQLEAELDVLLAMPSLPKRSVPSSVEKPETEKRLKTEEGAFVAAPDPVKQAASSEPKGFCPASDVKSPSVESSAKSQSLSPAAKVDVSKLVDARTLAIAEKKSTCVEHDDELDFLLGL